MDDVVVHAGMLRRLDHQRAQKLHRLHRALARLPVGRGETAHQVQCQIGFCLDFIGIRRNNRAQAFDVGFIVIHNRGIPSRSHSGNVKLLEWRSLSGRNAQFDGSLRSSHGTAQAAGGLLVTAA